jgi:imidazolonepropionase-like amidohydrolase
MQNGIRLALLASVICLGLSPDALAQRKKTEEPATPPPPKVVIDTNPFPSTYVPKASGSYVITGGHVFDGIGGGYPKIDVLVRDGRIVAVGPMLEVPAGTEVIEAAGRYVTPGIVDMHSHLGVNPSPGIAAHSDTNEATGAVTAQIWIEHSIWPQDPGFHTARAGGVTTLLILPGSANLVGGRGVVVKNVVSRTVQGMKFPDAPYSMKMACGENPKRVYGSRNTSPQTRAGNFAGYRAAWIDAAAYAKSWADYDAAYAKKPQDAKAPKRDLRLETLAGALNGDILVQMHCYRADEMALVLDMADEFGYKIASFHHAVESYKIPDLLAAHGACSAMWADWWGFKAEAYDSIRENIPFVHQGGACAAIHSDSAVGVQRLNQEVAKALADGRRAGLDISRAEAWKWLSSNPAKAIGVFDETGSLEPGKAADIVIWSTDPFSSRSRADQVFIDGVKVYDRFDPAYQAVSDFELGQTPRAPVGRPVAPVQGEAF